MESIMPLELVLVMPAYNEQGCIETVVNQWGNYLQNTIGHQFKILVINDGSKDNTKSILDTLQQKTNYLIVVHKENAGHGAALYHGYKMAINLNPQWIFQVDSDNQFIAQDFSLLWQTRDKSRFILGFRKHRHDDWVRLLITKTMRLCIYIFFGVWVEDANVPFRLMKTNFLAEVMKVLPVGLFAPNVFLTIIGAKMGYPLFFIPVTHQERKTGTVSIFRWKLFKVCFRSFIELILFRWHLSGAIRYLKNKGY